MCPSTCYEEDGNAGIGACTEGVPIYANEKTCELSDCVGDVAGVGEMCDGVDNDCDGVVDEVYATIDRRKDACDTLRGECAKSHVWCDGENGWVCEKPDTYENTEISCDGLDNDCSGLVDNIAISELTLCYSYDPITLVNQATGHCHPGYWHCDPEGTGQMTCVSEQGPKRETVCGQDADCDGQVYSQNTNQLDKWQIVFGVDYSGSMSTYINNLSFSLDTFVSQFSSPQYEFALVNIAAISPAHLELLVDFGPFSDLIYALDLGLDGSSEASIDAIHAVCGEDLVEFDPNAHKIYVGFTDEPGQSYTLPPQSILEGGNICFQNDVVVYMFSLNPYEWEDATDPTGGTSFFLSHRHRSMLDDLNTIIKEILKEVKDGEENCN